MILFSYMIESPKFNKVSGIKMLEMGRAAFYDSREEPSEHTVGSREGAWPHQGRRCSVGSFPITPFLSVIEEIIFLVHATFLIRFSSALRLENKRMIER